MPRIEIPALPFIVTGSFLLTDELDNPSWIPDPTDVPHFTPDIPLAVPVYRDLNTSHQAFLDAASIVAGLITAEITLEKSGTF